VKWKRQSAIILIPRHQDVLALLLHPAMLGGGVEHGGSAINGLLSTFMNGNKLVFTAQPSPKNQAIIQRYKDRGAINRHLNNQSAAHRPHLELTFGDAFSLYEIGLGGRSSIISLALLLDPQLLDVTALSKLVGESSCETSACSTLLLLTNFSKARTIKSLESRRLLQIACPSAWETRLQCFRLTR
jgi:hypothetical protein